MEILYYNPDQIVTIVLESENNISSATISKIYDPSFKLLAGFPLKMSKLNNDNIYAIRFKLSNITGTYICIVNYKENDIDKTKIYQIITNAIATPPPKPLGI